MLHALSCITSSQNRVILLRRAFPSFYQASRFPEFQTLFENDIPQDKFDLEFEEQQIVLSNSIANWRNELEANLVKMLPKNTHPPDFNAPGYTLTIGSEENDQPISSLPVDIQTLLRADATFRLHGTIYYYPDDFMEASLGFSRPTYGADTAKVAKRLLTMLGRPDASYLEMKAMGRVFQCGRCHSSPESMVWKSLVSVCI
jgi:hypothetical protein